MDNQYFVQFVLQLKQFVTELDTLHSTSGTKKFLERFDHLNMGKTIMRFLKVVEPNKNKVQDRDTSLFNQKFSFVPGVDLSKMWPSMTEDTKGRCWNYLQMLFIYAELVVDDTAGKEVGKDVKDMYHSMEEHVKHEKKSLAVTPKETDEKVSPLEFNPYEGVGEDNAGLSVTDLLSGELPPEEGEEEGGGGGMFNPMMLAQMAGLGGNMDMGAFASQLGNISEDDINQARDSIKSMLGGRDDPTSKMLVGMLDNISSELNNRDMTKGNPLENIFKIAENVAGKIKPKEGEEPIDMNALFRTAQEISKEASPGDGINPFQMMENLMKGSEGGTTEILEALKASGAVEGATGTGGVGGTGFDPTFMPIPDGVDKEEFLAEYNKALTSLGVSPPKKE